MPLSSTTVRKPANTGCTRARRGATPQASKVAPFWQAGACALTPSSPPSRAADVTAYFDNVQKGNAEIPRIGYKTKVRARRCTRPAYPVTLFGRYARSLSARGPHAVKCPPSSVSSRMRALRKNSPPPLVLRATKEAQRDADARGAFLPVLPRMPRVFPPVLSVVSTNAPSSSRPAATRTPWRRATRTRAMPLSWRAQCPSSRAWAAR